MQLKLFGTPIFGKPKNNTYEYFRPNIWKEKFSCFELTECMRQKGDDDFVRILNTARYMTFKAGTVIDQLPEAEREVINFLLSKNIQAENPEYPHDALHVFPTNRDVGLHNNKMMETIQEEKIFHAIDSKKDFTGSFEIQPNVKTAVDDKGLTEELKCGIGARVMITRNENVDDKIVNGTIGTVVGFSGPEGAPNTIWVRPDEKNVGLNKRKGLSRAQRKKYPNAIPVKRVEDNILIANDNSSYKRLQFPLKLCWGATIHKYQGRSLDILVIGGFDSNFWTPGMLYTALTRCRRAEGLFLLGFKTSALKANIPGKDEIERIRKESLVPTIHPRINFFDIYPESDWEFICLQNVRSVNMHKLDVLNDPIMMASSVICLTETSLSLDDWSGWKDFDLFTVYHKCRKDAHQNTSVNERKSGGVAILTKKTIESKELECNVRNLEITSSEAVIENESLSISLVYKDHHMPKEEFLTELEEVFKQKMNIPSIILGDFNINMLDDESLMLLQVKYKFIPMIDVGTTINGHLLDQIFVSNFPFFSDCDVVTLPTYFSDHDMLVLCIPKKKHRL